MGVSGDSLSDELVVSWTLVGNDWDLLANKSGVTRLGFALLLKFFESDACFPRAASDFSPEVVAYVGAQVEVDPVLFDAYEWSGRAIERHRAQIRSAFGFREFSRGDEEKVADWLAGEVCPVEQRHEQLREAVLVRCRSEQIEPPGRIERIIGSARAAFEKEFCESTVARLGAGCAARLEGLAADGADIALLAELKSDPGQVGLETLLKEVGKLAAIRALGLPAGLFAHTPDKLVEAWRSRAARAYPSDLRAMPAPVRLTLLAALCWQRSSEITDALVDLLIALVLKINTRADRRVERELTEDLRRVRGKEGILFRIAEPRPRSATPTILSGLHCIRWSGKRR